MSSVKHVEVGSQRKPEVARANQMAGDDFSKPPKLSISILNLRKE
jgi:hypothetical protein